MRHRVLSSFAALLILTLSSPALAQKAPKRTKRPVAEYPVQSAYEVSPKPLTTEQVWKIAPQEPNPHRRRWALERNVGLVGLRAEQKNPAGDGAWTIAVDGISAKTVAHFRPQRDGGVYHPFSRFPCSKDPVSWFATFEGTRSAARLAADLWEKQLDSDRVKLRVVLERIAVPTEAEALQRARETFATWLNTVESEWRPAAHRKARAAEWADYVAAARKEGDCKKFSTPEEVAETFVSWEKMMDQPSANKVAVQLVRAPARRWNGRFTIRLNITLDDKTLNGQFLVDTSSEKNLISPAWLSSQGVNPVLVELKSRIRRQILGLDGPQKITWRGKDEFARAILADKVEASNFKLDLNEFWLTETEVILPPQHIAVCCDGVLGLEFLRKYAVEFFPDAPAHLTVYDRDQFSLGKDVRWFEAATTKTDELVSASCTALSKKDEDKWKIPAVRWATGNDARLVAHTSWAKTRKAGGPDWDLECAGVPIADDIRIPEVWKVRQPLPGMTAGIQFMARGPFTLDLGNGRIWMSDEAVKSTYLVNESGLEVDFVYKDGNRGLAVESIRPKSPAAKLAKEGLKPGMFIAEINNTPVVDFDLWEIERLLSGIKGDTVTIEWQAGSRRKIVPLKVKPGPSQNE